MMSENKKIKGIGILPGDTIDGQPMPDRYYAVIKHGHLGIYDTLEEAIEAKRISELGEPV
jgi:hypothetical protein